MKRRELLGALFAAGVAGCVTYDTGVRTTPGVEPTRGPSATPVDDDPPTYRASGHQTTAIEGSPIVEARIDTVPKPVPLRPWFEFLAQPTSDRSGRIRVGLKNRSQQAVSIEGTISGLSSDAGIGIGSLDTDIVNGCPRRRGEGGNGRIDHTRVEPTESVARKMGIYTFKGIKQCFPPGEHRLQSVRPVFSDETSLINSKPKLVFEWGLTLVVE